jgi:hypothetical protein
MLKTIRRIQKPAQLKVVQKEFCQSTQDDEVKMSNLFNIDPHPESRKPPKIDLQLYQLEDLE